MQPAYQFPGQPDAVQSAPRDVTAFELLAMAEADSRGLAERVHALADQLVGKAPETSSPGAGAPRADGLFGATSEIARNVTSYVALCHAALGRIERALP